MRDVSLRNRGAPSSGTPGLDLQNSRFEWRSHKASAPGRGANSMSPSIDRHLDRLGQLPPLHDLLGDERTEVRGLVSDGLDAVAPEPRGEPFGPDRFADRGREKF